MPIFHSRWKLITILGLLLSTGFLAVNLAHYYVSSNSVRSALINNELPLTSNNVYSEIQASLLRPIYISSLMANDTFVKDWMLEGEHEVAKIQKYLTEIRNKYTVSSTFLVSANTRRYYHFEGVLKEVSPKIPKDQWFFSMPDHPGNYRVDVDTNEANRNLLTIFVNHKVFDYEGNFIGITGLGLDVISVAAMIDRYTEDFQRNIYFVDRNGEIKSHHDQSMIDKVNIYKLPGIEDVAQQILSGNDGFLIYPRDNDHILLSYRYIPELDWYLLVEQTESEALEPLRHALYFNMVISLLVTLVVLLISGFTINHFQSSLESMAKTDKLTGLFNRQYFDAILEHSIESLGRQQQSFTLALFDVDNLKLINDREGHLAGDHTLKTIAELSRKHTRKNDVIVRWGGDEFAILFIDCNKEVAAQLMERIRSAVESTLNSDTQAATVTISAGVAEYQAGESIDELLGRADKHLYRAKKLGRNRVEVSAP